MRFAIILFIYSCITIPSIGQSYKNNLYIGLSPFGTNIGSSATPRVTIGSFLNFGYEANFSEYFNLKAGGLFGYTIPNMFDNGPRKNRFIGFQIITSFSLGADNTKVRLSLGTGLGKVATDHTTRQNAPYRETSFLFEPALLFYLNIGDENRRRLEIGPYYSLFYQSSRSSDNLFGFKCIYSYSL